MSGTTLSLRIIDTQGMAVLLFLYHSKIHKLILASTAC